MEWPRVVAMETKRSGQARSLSQMIGLDHRLNKGVGGKKKERE